MRTSKFGEIVLDVDDLCDAVMQGRDVTTLSRLTVEPSVQHGSLTDLLSDPGMISSWTLPASQDLTLSEFDNERQRRWFMPERYAQLDIAAHVLGLCETQAQLQRAGHELLMYQERDLFDLLRYLTYLVDVMRDNGVIWGVGRGSSVSSYVLYLLGVHRIDSMFYDLDPSEFLR